MQQFPGAINHEFFRKFSLELRILPKAYGNSFRSLSENSLNSRILSRLLSGVSSSAENLLYSEFFLRACPGFFPRNLNRNSSMSFRKTFQKCFQYFSEISKRSTSGVFSKNFFRRSPGNFFIGVLPVILSNVSAAIPSKAPQEILLEVYILRKKK